MDRNQENNELFRSFLFIKYFGHRKKYPGYKLDATEFNDTINYPLPHPQFLNSVILEKVYFLPSIKIIVALNQPEKIIKFAAQFLSSQFKISWKI